MSADCGSSLSEVGLDLLSPVLQEGSLWLDPPLVQLSETENRFKVQLGVN